MVRQSITPRELFRLHEEGVQVDLLDVRTPVEFREVHPAFARNVPLDSLNPKKLMMDRTAPTREPIYVICRGGQRAEKACQRFRKEGYDNVFNVEGGLRGWNAAHLPVVEGQKAVSLERQVRIAAGALVLIGALLALFAHPYFAWLSAFIGAGLIFAGVTDTCGMAMVLARMPWNRCEKAACMSD